MNCVVKRLAVLLGGIVLSFAARAVTYTAATTSYGEDRPEDLAVANNVFSGVVPFALSNASAGAEETAGPEVLSDGKSCDAGHGKKYFYMIGNDAKLQWVFTAPQDIREFRFYAAWGDENRNDISVSSISYCKRGGEWKTIDGSSFASSQTASVNTIGEPIWTHDRTVSFAADADELLAEGAMIVQITFGPQDHDYGGYCEIQALGTATPSDPSDISDTFGGRPSLPGNAGLWAGFTGNNGWDTVSQVKPGESRFLGAYPAYINDRTHWFGVKADGSKIVCSWGGDQTYYYEGYMYFDDAVYTFIACIDDAAALEIDGTALITSPTYNDSKLAPKATWMPPRGAGWYPIKIRVGNGGGGYGPIDKSIGLGWNTTGYTTNDSSENWHKFIDPGDGTLLRTTPEEPLDIVGGMLQGETARKVCIDFSAVAELAGATASIAFTANPAGYTTGGLDWTQIASPVVEGTQYAVADVPQNATHVVVSAVKDGKTYWTGFVALASLQQLSSSQPMARLDAADVSANGELLAHLSVLDLGGAESVTATFKVATAGGEIVETEIENIALGTAAYPIDGLVANRTLNITVTVSNQTGSTDVYDVRSVYFNPSSIGGAKRAVVSGLLQGRKNAAWDKSFDILTGSDTTVAITPGASAAYVKTNTSWPGVSQEDGTTELSFTWGENMTYAYTGEMYFENKTYTFIASIDDTAQIKINGTPVLTADTFTRGAPGTWTPAGGAGWYPIEIRVGNGSKGYGPIDNYIGMGWNTTGYTTNDNSDNWNSFVDPGDASLLRTFSPAFPAVSAENGHAISTGYSATARIAGGVRTNSMKLYACYGATAAGDDPSAWAHSELVSAELSGADASFDYTGFSNLAEGEKVSYLRFLLEDGTKKSWSETLHVARSAAPVVATPQLIDATGGDTLHLAARLEQTGAGETAAVAFEYGLAADLSDKQTVALGSYAAGAAIERDVTTLPGKTYYYRLVATGTDDKQDVTDIASFETKAGAAFTGGLAASVKYNVVTYTATLADLGASNRVELALLTGTAADALETNATRVVTETGKVTFAVQYAFVNGTVYAKVVAKNACATQSWQTETPLLETEMIDESTYVWKQGVLQGNWTDPDNWVTEDPDNPYLTYPNSAKCDVNLKNCTEPTVITLTENMRVDWVITDGTKLNVTFRKDPAVQESVRLHTWGVWWNSFGGGNVVIDGLEFYCHDCGYMDVESFKVVNGAVFETNKEAQFHKSGSILEVSGGSLWLQSDWTLSIDGEGTKFILDNSTIRQAKGGEVYLARSSAGNGATIEVRGKSPVFDCDGVVSGRDSAPSVKPKIIFCIPEGGYTTAPFTRGDFLNGKVNTDLLIDPASPVFAGNQCSTKLVDGATIYKSKIEHEGQIRADRFALRYDGGTEENPTQLWFDFKKKGFCIIVQ